MLKKLILGTAATALLASGALAQEKPLTIVSWGGAYSYSQLKAYDEPYTAESGVQILHEDKSNQALAGIRSQVEAKNVTWNVVDMLQSDAQRACDEGLIMEINFDEWLAPAPDGKPASEDFIKEATGDCYLPSILYSTLFAYNDKAFPNEKPSTIADVWDVEKFPGKRALEKIPQKNLEWALIADGVPKEEVYDVLATKEGQDRAFASLDKLKPNVIWWEAGAQPPQMLADGEVTIATAYNGRFFDAQVKEKQPFVLIWEAQMYEADGWVVPAGQDDATVEEVKKYLRFATDTQRLADQAKYISYAPARLSSTPMVSTHLETGVDMKPHMPTSPENLEKAVRFNVEFWTDYGDALEERFNAWLAS